MSMAGLTPVASTKVKAPRVGESAVQMECTLTSATDLVNDSGAVTGTMFLGKVVAIHVYEALLDLSKGADSPQVKFDGYQPISRLGGNTYARTTETFDMPRPPYIPSAATANGEK
mmetsp:Transcript_37930/g.69344  ORF Transcript_37930/g.69344 Transcript_37930/m.69344 type:complete len:115 (+) Transcript_37930:3-347(+)